MRLVYLGSGEFGLPTLDALQQEHEIAAVITQPDRPAGRKRKLTATPVGQWAVQQDVTVFKTHNVNSLEFIEQVRSYHADAAVIIAFGQKLSPQLIGSMGRLAVNLHASLLPKYRGAGPINWAMIRGEKVTGVSVIGLVQQMDGGDVYASASLDIRATETAGELHERLARLGPKVIGKTLNDLACDSLSPEVQDEAKATRAPKLSKADGTVDFKQSAQEVRSRINGLTPWPGCCVNWHGQVAGKTQRLFLRRADVGPVHTGALPAPGRVMDGGCVAAADGPVRLLEVQMPGSRCVEVNDFIRGHQFASGDRLSELSSD
jgi:methionyl-tRNA formyltransferase